MPLFHAIAPKSSNDLPELHRAGFSKIAAICPPLWALANRFWLVAVLWVVGIAVLIGAAQIVSGGAAFALYLVAAIWFGFAAHEVRLDSADKADRDVTPIVAADRDTALLEALKLQSPA